MCKIHFRTIFVALRTFVCGRGGLSAGDISAPAAGADDRGAWGAGYRPMYRRKTVGKDFAADAVFGAYGAWNRSVLRVSRSSRQQPLRESFARKQIFGRIFDEKVVKFCRLTNCLYICTPESRCGKGCVDALSRCGDVCKSCGNGDGSDMDSIAGTVRRLCTLSGIGGIG